MIQRINLIPEELAEKHIKLALPVKYLIIIIAALLYIVPLYVNIKYSSKVKGIDAQRLELESKKLELVSNNVKFALLQTDIENKTKEIDFLKEKTIVLKSIAQKNIYWSDILKEVSYVVPENLWISEILSDTVIVSTNQEPTAATKEAKDKVEIVEKRIKELKIRGSSYNNKTITDFIASLEKSYFLTDIKLSFAKKRIIKEVFIVYDFEIVSTLKESGAMD